VSTAAGICARVPPLAQAELRYCVAADARRVLEQYARTQVSLTIAISRPRRIAGEEDAVVFTPTLVKRGPGPRTWIVGNLDRDALLIDLVEVSGVDRERDRR
jgi:hypothetical protein